MEKIDLAEPISIYGDVKICKNIEIIQKVVVDYDEYHQEAAKILEPDVPEIAMLFPVLTFNSLERATIAFYTSMELGKLDDDNVSDLRSWKKKLPEDDSAMYRHCAQLMKWN